ncbi:unnamed protein product [Lupinus luteus]|uniref:Uncharacterized protein n=1 Tax=Lupinus luteus TaxID=3873 RepID=A0AAV1XP65_LUPLU
MERVDGEDSANNTLNAALEENLKGSKVQDVMFMVRFLSHMEQLKSDNHEL